MRYVFLFHVFLVAAVIAIGGFRGMKFEKPPIQIFNDMDQQAKVKAQKGSDFFADGIASRPLIPNTVPVGYEIPEVPLAEGGKPGPGYSTMATDYYNTGRFGDYYGSGMPKELGLTEENSAAFLRRGQERYNIYCAVCHGESGNGQGVVAKAGFNNVRNLLEPIIAPDKYADGAIYNTIVHGKGLMFAYGDKLNVHDRWAVVAWVRVLQKISNGVPATEPGVKELIEKLPAPAAPKN
jgi:mono/diheme cytochrome c family protein